MGHPLPLPPYIRNISRYVQHSFDVRKYLENHPHITSAELAQILLMMDSNTRFTSQTPGLTLPIPSFQPSPDLNNNNQRVQQASFPVFNPLSTSTHPTSPEDPVQVSNMDYKSTKEKENDRDLLTSVKQESIKPEYDDSIDFADEEMIVFKGHPTDWPNKKNVEKTPNLTTTTTTTTTRPETTTRPNTTTRPKKKVSKLVNNKRKLPNNEKVSGKIPLQKRQKVKTSNESDSLNAAEKNSNHLQPINGKKRSRREVPVERDYVDTTKRTCKPPCKELDSIGSKPGQISKSHRIKNKSKSSQQITDISSTNLQSSKEKAEAFFKSVKDEIEKKSGIEARKLLKTLKTDEILKKALSDDQLKTIITMLLEVLVPKYKSGTFKHARTLRRVHLCLEFFRQKVEKFPWNHKMTRTGQTYNKRKTDGYMFCAKSHLQLNDLEKAQGFFQMLVRQKPENALACGEICEKHGQFEEAFNLYLGLSEPETCHQGKANNNLGLLLEKKLVHKNLLESDDDYIKMVLGYYKKAVASESATAECYNNLGKFYMENAIFLEDGKKLAATAFAEGFEKFDDQECIFNLRELQKQS
jgi:tetratricopeptide (TPR) repeat protein